MRWTENLKFLLDNNALKSSVVFICSLDALDKTRHPMYYNRVHQFFFIHTKHCQVKCYDDKLLTLFLILYPLVIAVSCNSSSRLPVHYSIYILKVN